MIIGPDNAVQGEIYFGSPVDESPLGAAPGAAGHKKISFLLKCSKNSRTDNCHLFAFNSAQLSPERKNFHRIKTNALD